MAPVRSRLTISTAYAAIEGALQGIGLTRVLACQVADAMHDKRLVRVLIVEEPPAVPVSLIYPGQGRPSDANPSLHRLRDEPAT